MDYPLEHLTPEAFQRVCGALLLREFPSARFLPLGQADGGRDGFTVSRRQKRSRAHEVVFQVKFARDAAAFRDAKARRKWVLDALDEELPTIQKLHEDGVNQYRLVTNVRGSGARRTGSIDKLDELFSKLPFPADAWWRDDLLTRLDDAWDIKWRYPELMTGPDLLRALVEGGLTEDASRRTSAIRIFLDSSWQTDATVKFKQVGLENDLLELFVDLPLQAAGGSSAAERRAAHAIAAVSQDLGDAHRLEVEPHLYDDEISLRYAPRRQRCPAAGFLLHEYCPDFAPWVVVEGAPGQGKSTVSQYVCQVHRGRLLHLLGVDSAIPDSYRRGGVRLPFRVDLRDLAAWLHGRNPFGEDVPDSDLTTRRTLETFLAAQVEAASGGSSFSVADLHAVCRTSALLLALDGLDEVADIREREKVVGDTSAGLKRLRSLSPDLQVIVTSRPAAFENSPGFGRDSFVYLDLAALTEAAIDEYTEKWIKARGLAPKDARDVRRVVKDRLEAPHMRELARNPMQLTILVTLVHQRGPSLPDKRTALYDNYVSLFFDREAEKTRQVAEHRELLQEIHQYLAWRLQAEAEQGRSEGSITDNRLRELLVTYLEREDKNPSLVDVLFTSLVERVVAIVSRVQGTYEFEVQPLREYFAARFLYDTAHHSSPGNEKAGDKSDRFDALARNFYWLNVTRFFAGCFSRGELLSLVERLQELAEAEGFRNTDHPQTLAAMLLSDWVFAQQPRSMKQVVELVLSDITVQDDRTGSSSAITLPDGSGRDEVAARCWELWEQRLNRDRSLAVARTLQANSNRDVLDARWLDAARGAARDARTEWLERGVWSGSLPRAPIEVADELIAEDGERWRDVERLGVALRAGQDDVFAANDDRARFAVGMILEGLVSGPMREREPTRPLEALASARFCAPPWGPRPQRRDRSRAVDSAAFASDLLASAAQWAALVRETFGLRDQRAVVSLVPWRTVVEDLRQRFEDCYQAVELAICSSAIRAAGEKGSIGEGLSDRTQGLCDRARYARFRAGVPSWWSAQLADAPGELDQLFVVGLFFTCASDKTFLAAIEEFDAWLQGASSSAGERLTEAVMLARHFSGMAGRQSGTMLQIAGLPENLCPATVLLVDRRYPFRPPDDDLSLTLYERYLQTCSPERDRAGAAFAASAAIAFANQKPEHWPIALKLVREAYSAGVMPTPHELARRQSSVPSGIASEIVGDAEAYPVALVAMAREACRAELGKDVIPLAVVADSQDWEWR